MEQEEMRMLRENIDEFCTRNIADIALKIENSGITQDLVTKLAGQGFMGARINPENGGSGLDEDSYRIVLERGGQDPDKRYSRTDRRESH